MNKKALLKKLEELYSVKEVKDGFPSQQACINWSNKVAPLLKFNQQYYLNFIQNAHKMNLRLFSSAIETAFKIMVSQLQMAIEELKMELESNQNEEKERDSKQMYIDKSRIEELENVTKKDFDLSKLIRMLEEMNICYQNSCYFGVILLARAIMDHVPPIFGYSKFSEVANNYKGSKSFKESMKHLEESCRKIADQHLHCQIRKSEVLPNKTQIDFKNDIDVLLAEIVRIQK